MLDVCYSVGPYLILFHHFYLQVVLETEITNKPALRLYENLGFVRDKRLFRYYLNGVDALRLKLWLRWWWSVFRPKTNWPPPPTSFFSPILLKEKTFCFMLVVCFVSFILAGDVINFIESVLCLNSFHHYYEIELCFKSAIIANSPNNFFQRFYWTQEPVNLTAFEVRLKWCYVKCSWLIFNNKKL